MIETKNKPRMKGKITYTDGREETLEYGTEKIERDEYKSRDDILSIVLPNSVESIEYDAFAECAELESVALQNGVIDIGHYAFRNCPKLASVTLCESIENIGAGIFLNCGALREVFIPQKVKFDKQHPFEQCNCKITVHPGNPYYKVIDGDVYSIDGKTLVAHISNPDEKSFAIPEGVERLGAYSFSRCEGIEKITVPSSVRIIDDSVFSGCEALESIEIPQGVGEISAALFYACINLKSVYIPASVKSIGFAAFESCPSISEIYYGGKKLAFKKIKIRERNENLKLAKIICK